MGHQYENINNLILFIQYQASNYSIPSLVLIKDAPHTINESIILHVSIEVREKLDQALIHHSEYYDNKAQRGSIIEDFARTLFYHLITLIQDYDIPEETQSTPESFVMNDIPKTPERKNNLSSAGVSR